MAKRTTPDQWDKARALFEAGKSLGDIYKMLGIDRSTISKRAKKEGWIKGAHQQIIADASNAYVGMATLSSTARQVVEKEIEERVKHIQFFNNATLKNLSVMMRKVNDNIDITEHKIAQDALAKGRETVLGKQPDTAIQINSNDKAIEFNTLSDDELDREIAAIKETW